MGRTVAILILVMTSTFFAEAQNGWIDYDRFYYKIPTAEDGIHRITFASLSSAGINPNTLDPRNIRLYHRGEEVAIYVEGEQDGRFDTNDFIDFFGKRNDATLDAKLFNDPSHVGNIMYNHHNDSTAFFLTVTQGTPGKRMATRPAPIPTSPLVDTYTTENMTVFSDQYNLGRSYFPGVRLAEFEEGQGWMSTPVTKPNPRTVSFTDLGEIGTGSAKLEIGLVGRSENPHITAISVGPTIGTLREVGRFEYTDFNVLNEVITIETTDFNSDGSISIRVSSLGPDATDNVSIAYVRHYLSQKCKRRGVGCRNHYAGSRRIRAPVGEYAFQLCGI
jgi:hypothetical protein